MRTMYALSAFVSLLTKELPKIEIALPAGLWCALGLGRMIGHRLDAQATRASKAVENKGRSSYQTANCSENATTALRTSHGRHAHLHRRIFPQPCARLYVQSFSGGQHLFKDIPITVQEYHALAAHAGELVDKNTCAAKQNISRALHKRKVVVNVAGGE